MIRARDIRAGYGLDGVSLEFDTGFVALVGPNGSGKTSLIRSLAGVLPVRGELSVSAPFAYLPQKLEFLPTMRVRDVVGLGRAPHLGRLGRLSDSDLAQVEAAMRATDTHRFADREVGSLSGGEQARVGLARALAVEAPILFADEPMASLDAGVALDILQTLKAQPGLVVCALHDLALARRFADRVIVLKGGRVVADGEPSILDGPIVTDVFGISPPPGGWQTPERAAKGAG